MWYFTWVLGVGFACAFAVLNAMWLELQADRHTSTVVHQGGANAGDAGRTLA